MIKIIVACCQVANTILVHGGKNQRVIRKKSVPRARSVSAMSLTKLDVFEPHGFSRLAGFFKHLRKPVYADNFALLANLMRSDKTVKPPADPASTTLSPCSRDRSENGFATPANDSTAASGIESTSAGS